MENKLDPTSSSYSELSRTTGEPDAPNGHVHSPVDSEDIVDRLDQKSESSPPMDDEVEPDVGEAVKEDMFVDCSEDLVTANADHREAIVTMGTEESSEEQNCLHESGAEESIRMEYTEERVLFTREVSGLHHQLKLLLGKEDSLVGDTPLLEMVKDCTRFVKTVSEEWLQNEVKMRELHAEIEDLNARVSELSVSNDVVASYLGSNQNEQHRNIEDVVNRMLDSLSSVGCQEEILDGNDCGKLIQVEKSTLLLIDRVQRLEDENSKFVEQIEKDKEMVERMNAELGNTKMELEQEKVRCANTKEKLSMAVTKGKALVQHRDSLKQSLAEKTSELEKCLSELREKSSALDNAELSKEELVRKENLVASLQENLLQRDSILEIFEEILSQNGVPEELQSLDIIERFRWLVNERNVLKSISLQFQSLKDTFSSIDLPETVSSADLQAQVGWLTESFYGAKDEISTLQGEIARSREAARNEIDSLSASLLAALQEKDYLQTELADMISKYEKIVEEEHQVLLEKNSLSASLSAELEKKDSLLIELADLKAKYEEIVGKEIQVSLEKDQIVNMLLEVSGGKVGNEEEGYQSSDKSVLLQRCLEKIKEQSDASSDSSHVNAELFERVQSHLFVRDQELMLCNKLLEEEIMVKSEVDKLSNELKMVYEELVAVKEGKDSLQKDLERSEEKSALLREKLSMAVKKGKGLVQDRENLKGMLEEKNSEIEKLKLDLRHQESEVAKFRNEINGLSSDVERLPDLEADLVAMKDQRDQLEQFLLESNKSQQRLVEAIEGIVLPVESVFEDPVGKLNWLAGYVDECIDSQTRAEQELGKVQSELAEAQATLRSLEDSLSMAENSISQLAEEKREIEAGKTNVEQELRKAIEETQATVRSMEDALSVAENNISRLAEEKREIELGKTNVEQELQKALEASQAIVRSLEDALSVAENNISRLSEEKREIEVGRTNVEQELQKAFQEACSQSSNFVEACAASKSLEEALSLAENNVSVLIKEREEAQVSRAETEVELEKVKEEVAMQTGKLTEAYETIKSLEDSLSQVEANIVLLTEQNNDAQLSRTNLEKELKKLHEEAGSQADKLTDAHATIKSLEHALLRAENEISVLEGVKKSAEEEVSSLNSKLSAALEELAGTSGSLESRSVELAGHYNDLQVIMKDDALSSKLKECFEKKFESLNNMDVVLKNIRSHFVDIGFGELQSQHVLEDDFHDTKPLSDKLHNILNVEIDSSWVSDTDGDNISSHFRKTVEGFQSKNQILVDKFEGSSFLVDEFIVALLKKLRAMEDGVVVIVERIKSLKQRTKDLEMYKQEKESTLSTLEDDVKTLSSLCTDATRELQFQLKNNLLEKLSYVPELERSNHSLLLELKGSDGDTTIEQERGFNGRKHLEAADNLLFATRKIQTLIKQFESASNVAAATIEELQNKLKESRKEFEKAMEERDLNQNMVFKLETEVETLQDSCSELRLQLKGYQTEGDRLKEREAEVSSLRNLLSLKEQEAEGSLLSASQLKTLFDKVERIEIPMAESEVGDVEPHTSAYVKKLFNIVDNATELWQQVNLLSRDKEELESTLARQVLEIEHLKEEVDKYIRDKPDSEKMKNELSELRFGLENIIGMFKVGYLVDQKFTGAQGLLSVIEKEVSDMLLESENSKSKVQKLGTDLLASQKAVDELSIKVSLLEDSVQGRSAQQEMVQERNIREAPLPTGSEISEIEDAVSVGQNPVSSVPPAAHVRTLRKGSTDHLAISIDSESERLINNEGTVEDKGHVFKSLNTSGLIPKQGKLMADRVDGIWVSGGRVLMNHPRARLGVIAYCLLLHIWLLGTIL